MGYQTDRKERVEVTYQKIERMIPDKEKLNKKDVLSVLGYKTYQTLQRKDIPFDKYGKIGKRKLAEWIEK